MKTKPDHDSLLTDVLGEAAPGNSHAQLLEETLGHVRQRRRVRLAVRTLVPLLVLGMVWSAWWSARPSPPDTAPLIARCPIVHTRPLPVSAIVTTQHFDPSRLIVTTGFVGTVRTTPGRDGVRLVGDAELLAFVGPRPAVLVRIGPGAEELIFVDQGGQSGNRLQ